MTLSRPRPSGSTVDSPEWVGGPTVSDPPYLSTPPLATSGVGRDGSTREFTGWWGSGKGGGGEVGDWDQFVTLPSRSLQYLAIPLLGWSYYRRLEKFL